MESCVTGVGAKTPHAICYNIITEEKNTYSLICFIQEVSICISTPAMRNIVRLVPAGQEEEMSVTVGARG